MTKDNGYMLDGEVVRHEKRTTTRKVTEGIGDNKTTRILEEDIFILTVLGSNGERVRLQKGTAFDAIVGSNATVRLSLEQTTIEDHDAES